MRITAQHIATTIATSCLALLGACGSDSATAPSTLTDAQTQQVGAGLSAEVGALMSGFLETDAESYGGLANGSLEASRRVLGMTGLAATQFQAVPHEPCYTRTPAETSDSDGDFVPDTASVTFDCHAALGNASLDLTGTVGVADADETQDLSYRASYDGLTFHAARNDSSLTIALSGQTDIVATHLLAAQANNVVATVTATGYPALTIHNHFSASFTPASGDSLHLFEELPAGDVELAGGAEYTNGSNNWVFTLSTPTPLRYDPTCPAGSSMIRTGVARATLSSGGPHGAVQLTYANCAQPTAIFVVQP